MKQKSEVTRATQQTFVVTAVFMTQKTVMANSVTQALQVAEDELAAVGATSKDLCNWYAHQVEE